MPFNEDMPNYNRKNPFVIQCKMTRDLVDETALDLIRELVRSSLICGLFAFIILAIFISASIILADAMLIHVITGVFIGINTVIIYFLIAKSLHIRRNLISDGLMDSVDRELNAEVSEILRMNNEDISNLTRKMTMRVGEMNAERETLLRLWMISITSHLMVIAVAGIIIALSF